MLELTGVSYRYAGYAKAVLHDLDLTLADGEIVGLVGPNEAGKSTLCLVASGLAPASIGGALTGTLTIDGEPMAGRKTHELASRVVVGFQNPNTQRSGIAATVFEEVALGPMNLGSRGARDRRADARRRWRCSTSSRSSSRDPARLSGGQAQLVAIAALLAMRPRHVILDEPTAQLDPAGTRLVGEALRQLAAGGTSLLIAEHKTDLLDGALLPDRRDRRRPDRARRPGRRRSSPTRGSRRSASSRRRACRLTRALDRGRHRRGDRGGRGRRRWTAVGVIEVEDLVHVYPGGTRALDGVDRSGSSAASGSRSSARTAAASRRSSATSTACSARPRGGSSSTASTPRTLRVAELAAKVGLAFQDPDRQIFAGQGPVGGRVRAAQHGRCAEPRSAAAVDEALAAAGLERRRGREPVRPGLLAPEAARAGLDPRDADAGRRPRRADDRPGRPRRRAGPADRRRTSRQRAGRSSRSATTCAFVAEAFERVVVMRDGRVVLDGTPAEVFAESAWPTLASTYLEPPLAGAGRRPDGPRHDADRGVARRRAHGPRQPRETNGAAAT